MNQLEGKTFKAISLGCKVNYYETESISRYLESKGLLRVDSTLPSDISIVNTCAVTEEAARKTRQHVRKLIKLNPEGVCAVIGCLSQIDTEVRNIEGVKIALGTNNKGMIYEALLRYYDNPSCMLDLVNSEDKDMREFENFMIDKFDAHTRAFMKIEDGCNNFCSYCIIPYARGRVRSKPLDVCIKEANDLVENGHKEIVLTGIDTGSYGKDINSSLLELLREMIKIDGLERIRISSIEMMQVTEEIVSLINESDKIVKHIHVPLQAASNHVLKLMNRHYNIETYMEKIKMIREKIEGVSITTDYIVGFPTETDEDFEESLRNLKLIGFDTIHTFPYSIRKGTKAAEMKQVPPAIKKERSKKVLELSKIGQESLIKKNIGTIQDCIFEIVKDGYMYGHTGTYIYCKAKADFPKLNKMTKVKLVENDTDAVMVEVV